MLKLYDAIEENTVIEKQYKMETSPNKIKGLFYKILFTIPNS